MQESAKPRPERAPAAVPAGVPTVAFYGEPSAWSTSALVHSEPLIERSRLHEWRIRPHRHSSLAQLFLLSRGSGTARFDGADYALRAPCVAVVPALCVHEFEWSQDSDGFALSVASALINDLEKRLGPSAGVFRRVGVIDDAAADGDGSDGLEFIATLFAQIHAEYVGDRPHRESAVESLLGILAIRIVRIGQPPVPAKPGASRANRHYQRFLELVEQQHRDQRAVADYAAELGITAPHLNAICRKLNGTSALRIVHDRLLLAARRDLIYTDKSIAGVAAGLGFNEPSYFTRFFRRHMGTTPKAYRRQSGTSSG